MKVEEYRGRVFVEVPSLKRVLKEHGVSQHELARRSGISFMQINRIANHKSRPTFGTAQRLARAIGVPLTEMVVQHEEKPEEKELVTA